MTFRSAAKTAVLALLAAGAVVTSAAPAQAQPYWGHPVLASSLLGAPRPYWGPRPYFGPRPYGPYFWGGRHYFHRRWFCGYYGRGCAWRYW